MRQAEFILQSTLWNIGRRGAELPPDDIGELWKQERDMPSGFEIKINIHEQEWNEMKLGWIVIVVDVIIVVVVVGKIIMELHWHEFLINELNNS